MGGGGVCEGVNMLVLRNRREGGGGDSYASLRVKIVILESSGPELERGVISIAGCKGRKG